VNNSPVADSHVVADLAWSAGVNMEHGAVLDVRSRANVNRGNVATHGNSEPNARVRPDLDIARNHTSGREKRTFRDLGCYSVYA